MPSKVAARDGSGMFRSTVPIVYDNIEKNRTVLYIKLEPQMYLQGQHLFCTRHLIARFSSTNDFRRLVSYATIACWSAWTTESWRQKIETHPNSSKSPSTSSSKHDTHLIGGADDMGISSKNVILSTQSPLQAPPFTLGSQKSRGSSWHT